MDQEHTIELPGRELTNDRRRKLFSKGPFTLMQTDSGLLIMASEAKQHFSAFNREFIPHYNILWAEASNSALTIDYISDPSKPPIKLKRLSWPLPSAKDDQEVSQNEADRMEKFKTQLLCRAYDKAKPQKRALVLVNPNSGPGGAVKKWEREVKPLFQAARMGLDVEILSGGGQATRLAEGVDIDKYDTIIACSGDGTPHEIFNGLAKRPDANRALSKIAVSHIPYGSGNAMALNLYGSNDPGTAAMGIIKGVVTELDLISITQGPRRLVSFLSQTLGLIAEADLATEHLRWMGSKRFEVGLLQRIYRKSRYQCDIAVKVEIEDKDDIKAHYKRQANETSGTNTADEQECDIETGHEGMPQLKYGTIQDELPEGWTLVPHDNIGVFYCGNMALMSPDANFFRAARPSDGYMDLVTIEAGMPRFETVMTFVKVESDKFFDIPHVSYKKISAYRIIPRGQEDGFISIDGERVPFEPFQAEIHQGLGRVLSKNGAFEAAGPKD